VESFKIYSFLFFFFHILFVSFSAPPYQKHQMTEKWKTSSNGNGSHPILKTRSFRLDSSVYVFSFFKVLFLSSFHFLQPSLFLSRLTSFCVVYFESIA
jgi:hypothetical protein